MKIAIVGTGYVGLVTGACFASVGHDVTCIDINENKIKDLNDGIIPIYEPGLGELIKKHRNNIHFTTQLSDCIDDVDVVFCAVGTPPDEYGSADLRYVLAVAREVGRLMNHRILFVTKSTVPVGTSDKVKDEIVKAQTERNLVIDFGVASNPEFLKEGSAIDDFMFPDRVVCGTSTKKDAETLFNLYAPIITNGNQFISTDIKSAEMIKYASNAMLAVRISFINEIANLCGKVGANIDDVARGVGADHRIGPAFLKAGCGYGGSCFPKDVKALIKTGHENGVDMRVAQAAELTNEYQKERLYDKLIKYIIEVDNRIKNVAVLGLAFKPETDDTRESPAFVLINSMLYDIFYSFNIIATDPIVRSIPFIRNHKYKFEEDVYKAIGDADAVILVTDWDEYKEIDWRKTKAKLIIDGRNCLDGQVIRNLGKTYYRIG